jgi:hypothetical protein
LNESSSFQYRLREGTVPILLRDHRGGDARRKMGTVGFGFPAERTMTQIEAIQAEILSLSSEDFARLREWIAERDWQNWDRQIERDSTAGKLDFLQEEADAAKQQGTLRDL